LVVIELPPVRAEEWLAVVDDHDRVIGRETRGRVHALRLKHRAVHVMLFNSSGALFVQKRSMNKECNPGLWDTSAAGHVDDGEDYDACARRELEEELGVVVEDMPQRLYKIAASRATGEEFVWVYHCTSDQPPVINREEIDAGRWVDRTELGAWLTRSPGSFTGTFRLIGARLLEQGGRGGFSPDSLD
jgi:isopentenyl-diphosphate delta-isomerase type 1